MEIKSPFKNNPLIEASKRICMSYLLLINPKMIEVMRKTGASFFHGTNANALPSILKHGINSVNKSKKDNIEITTGEEWSRIQGKRSFVSITDCLDISLSYANLNKKSEKNNSLLNFGVIIGISLQNMKDIKTIGIESDISEIGVEEKLPLDNIKFLSVPEDKVDFVKKLIGQKNIEIIGMNTDDMFYNLIYLSDRLEYLKTTKINDIRTGNTSKIFEKEEVKEVVQERKTSSLKKVFNNFKIKMQNRFKKSDSRNTSERG